jgi:hypothetical protein
MEIYALTKDIWFCRIYQNLTISTLTTKIAIMTELPSKLDPSEQVEVEWNSDDIWVPSTQLALGKITPEQYANLPQHTVFSLTRGEMNNFCSPCDYLGEDGICKRFGLGRQTRYVARKWCGWSEVNDVRGNMTENGFVTVTNIESSE